MSSTIDVVGAAIREAAATAVIPRFRTLTSAAVTEKAPGDWVTDADHECEELLTETLHTIEPGVPVIGEEAAASDPAILSDAERHDRAWVLDPVDGTKSFIDGSPDFATMVALIEGGVTTAAWIWQPIHGQMYTAVRGGPTQRNGELIAAAPDAVQRSTWQGVLRTHTMPAPIRSQADDGMREAGLQHTPIRAAGITYPMAVTGLITYALYWRTLPWDHAPGALLAESAGLTVHRLDGSEYRPLDGRQGLLTAANTDIWATIAQALPDELTKKP